MIIQSFDFDGVIYISDSIPGLKPHMYDIIITGRSFEEEPETHIVMNRLGLGNKIYFNARKFAEKTRISSGIHKGRTLKRLISDGMNIVCHYDDDEVQLREIAKFVQIPLIHIVHNLTEKENVRRP